MALSGLGAAGTRVGKLLGLDDEVLAYIYQALVGSAAGTVVLTFILSIYLILGWWALSIWLAVVGFIASVIIMLYATPRKPSWRIVLGNLWAVGLIIPFVPVYPDGSSVVLLGEQWYGTIKTGFDLIWAQITVIAFLDWYWYVGGCSVLFLLWAWLGFKDGWRTVLIISVLIAAVGVMVFSDGDKWLDAWTRLKYLLIPYSIAPMIYSILLMVVMTKEMLFPNLEWTLNPVALEELRETGLLGLWFPGLFSKSKESEPEEEEPERQMPVVRAEHREDGENGAKERYGILPFSSRARDFYKAMASGRPFTLSTARQCRIGRRTFENKIRQVFLDREWLRWKDEQHHDQGVKLTRAGWEMLEELVKSDPRV